MIRLGIVGFGRGMELLLKYFCEIEPNIEIGGIVDPNAAEVKQRLSEQDNKKVVFYESLKELVKHTKPTPW